MADSTKTALQQGAASRRPVIDPALRDDLRERGLAAEHLCNAWRQVKANPGAPSVEGRTVADFPACAREHWPRIRQTLRDETEQPPPVRRTEIPTRQGQGRRWVGLPTVGDRRLQPASAQVLGPLLAPEFSASSGGVRPGRSAPHAGKPLPSDRQLGSKVAGERDLTQLFGRVNPEARMARVARKVRAKALLRVSGQ